MDCMIRREHHSCSGTALLELVLILPFILMVVLTTVEVSRLLRAAQLAQAVSREASNAIYRRCSDFFEPDGEDSNATIDRTQLCVQNVWDTQLKDVVAQIASAGTSQVVMSIYRRVAAPSGGKSNVQRFALVNNGAGTRITRFSTNGTTVSQSSSKANVVLDATFLLNHRRLAIAEVYFQVSPIIQFIPLLNGPFFNGDYYAASLL